MGSKAPIIPRRIEPGGTIGIAAPSSAFDAEGFSKGVQVLETMGFQVQIPAGIYDRNRYLAGTDDQRAWILNQLFADPGVDAIVCARGGFGALRILNRLDYDLFARNPKPIIGFSDVTALLTAINNRCGLVVFHGPNVTGLGKSPKASRQAFFEALTSDRALSIASVTPRVIYRGRASGPLAGGNLTTLCHLLGTPYQPQFEKRILLLEDRNEACYRIDRMLTQMKMAGCFERLAGVLLGSFKQCGKSQEIHTVVAETFEPYNVPILAGFDIGHGRENDTIPLGIPATMDTETGVLAFQRPATGSYS